MSPYLHDMFDNAADDGGRPMALDLEAVRASGRRAVWMRRAAAVGGGLGAAAVITSVAILASGGDASSIQPAGSGDGDQSTAMDGAGVPAHDPVEALAPLAAALKSHGYELGGSGDGSGQGVSGVSVGGVGSDAPPGAGDPADAPSYSAVLGLGVTKDGSSGGALAAEFSDRSALGSIGSQEGDEPCAVLPDGGQFGFTWETCEPHEGADGSTVWYATGADEHGTGIGVTLVRADGSGISVTLTTATYDPDGDVAGTPLDQVPLTLEELDTVVGELDDAGPLLPPIGDGQGIDASPGVPCGEATRDDGATEQGFVCEQGMASSADVDSSALADALKAAGITVADVGANGGSADGGTSSSVVFELTGPDGRSGMASVGVADTLEVAASMNDTSAAWCAVTPTYDTDFAWTLADDPGTPCTDDANQSANPLVVVHGGAAPDAIGATLVRDDGSVISVSISLTAYSTPFDGPAMPLTQLPLDKDGMVALLMALDQANPAA